MGSKSKPLTDPLPPKRISGNNRIRGDVECPPPKKLKTVYESKCTNLEEWFDDVTFVSAEKESPTVGIEREVSVYLGAKKILTKI